MTDTGCEPNKLALTWGDSDSRQRVCIQVTNNTELAQLPLTGEQCADFTLHPSGCCHSASSDSPGWSRSLLQRFSGSSSHHCPLGRHCLPGKESCRCDGYKIIIIIIKKEAKPVEFQPHFLEGDALMFVLGRTRWQYVRRGSSLQGVPLRCTALTTPSEQHGVSTTLFRSLFHNKIQTPPRDLWHFLRNNNNNNKKKTCCAILSNTILSSHCCRQHWPKSTGDPVATTAEQDEDLIITM